MSGDRERQSGGLEVGERGLLERAPAPLLSTPEHANEQQARQERLRAESLVLEVEQLGRERGDAWNERKAGLERRLAQLRERLRAPAGGSTARADDDRAAAAAALVEAAEALARAQPPRVAGAVTGEEELLTALRDKTIEKGELLDWFAGLSSAERATLWRRYQRASSGTREQGAAPDEVARAFASYVAATRIRGDVEHLVHMSAHQIAGWRAHRDRQARADAGRASRQAVAPAEAGTRVLGGAAEAVAAAAGLAHVALGRATMPDAELARLRGALEALGDALHEHAGKRSPADERALAAALHAAEAVADRLAERHGPRGEAEVTLRAHVAFARRQAGVAEASPAARRGPEELRATAAASLALLEQSRGVVAAVPRPPSAASLAALDDTIATTTGWSTSLAADAPGARRLSAAVMDQHLIVAAAAGELRDVLARRITRSTPQVLEAYVHALATSTARDDRAHAALERARHAAWRQALDLVDEELDRAADATAELGTADRDAALRARSETRALAERKERLEARIARGERVAGGAMDELVLDAREQAFTDRVRSIEARGDQLAEALDSMDDGVLGWLANGGDQMLPILVDDLHGLGRVVQAIRKRYRQRRARDESEHRGEPAHDPARLAERAAALDEADERLESWLATGRFAERMRAAYDHIETAQIRLLIVNLGFQLGLTIVGAGAARLVAGGVTRALGAAEGAEAALATEATIARVAGVAGGAADMSLNILAQKGIAGDDGSVLTLAAVNLTSSVVLGRLHAHFGDVDRLMKETSALSSRWARAGNGVARWGVRGAVLTDEVLLGAAVDYSVRRLAGARAVDPTSQGELDWLLQGASIALGRAMSRHVEHLDAELAARRAAGVAASASEHELTARAESVRGLALEAETTGDPATGRALVEASVALAHVEQAALAELRPVRVAVAPERVASLVEGVRADGDARVVVSAGREEVRVAIATVADAREVTAHAGADGHRIDVPATMSAEDAEVAVAGKLTEIAHRERRRATGRGAATVDALGERGQGTAFSPADFAMVAELRALRRQRHEAIETGPDGRGRVTALDDKLAALERRMGLDDSARGVERRRMVEVQLELEADAPRRDEAARRLDGDRGHAGVELHTHWMGIVDVEVFRARAAIATHGHDDGSWLPLLEQIAAMDSLVHTYDAQGTITRRSPAGDAMAIAIDLASQAKQLRALIKSEPWDGELATSRRHALEQLAESGARHALATSPETDFNSAYEIRDELVKKNFAGERRDGESDDARVARGYDEYTREAILALVRDHVDVAEPSNSVKKMEKQFGAQRIERAVKDLIASGQIAPDQLDLRFLAMVTTNFFGGRPSDASTASGSPPTSSQWEAARSGLKAQLGESHIGGVDIAGQELFWFDPVLGGDRFAAVYDDLLAAATIRGQRLTLRPHVGEGAVDTLEGMPYHRDENRQHSPDGTLPHYERARHNLDAILTVVERLRAEGRYDPARVEIRFGHATHATPEQVVRMKALGIAAEVNLGSNVATGAIDQTIGTVDGRPSPVELYDDHGLPTMIYYGATTVLSTDAHSVMSTSMRDEYARASRIIDEILTGGRRVRVRAAEARERGSVRDDLAQERWLAIHELTADERRRFTTAYEKMHADAAAYASEPRPLNAGGSRE